VAKIGIFGVMSKKILYLGDTSLETAAAYLAGVMVAHNIEFDYLSSSDKFGDELLGNDYGCVIISDYSGANFTGDQLEKLAEQVNNGMGLLMIGGWESFTGPGIEYTNTILAEVLPVIMQASDDRVNSSGPCLIEKICEHAILGSLPFESNAPGIGGFNRFSAKADAEVILQSRMHNASFEGGSFKFESIAEPAPLLVTGVYGCGRVCAMATDAAPHWAGGLVDWGKSRVEAQADGAEAIEVGNWYAELFSNIIKWTAGSL
jgi:uncharacterized membrane protein